MHSENTRKLSKIYTMIYDKNFNDGGFSRAVVNQTSIMGIRWRNNLDHLKIAADSLMGVPDNQIAPIDRFEEPFDYEKSGADRFFNDIVAAGKADTREITLTIDDKGRLTMQFDGVQNLQIITTDHGAGKPVTTMVGEGSMVEAHLTLTINADEFNRLASLDYTKFDDTQARETSSSRKTAPA